MSSDDQGPLEKYVRSLWAQASDHYGRGEVWEYFSAEVEQKLADFAAKLPTSNASVVNDFNRARAYDQAYRSQFMTHVKIYEDYRRRVRETSKSLTLVVSQQAHFVMQALAFANGSVVLSTLAYIGSKGSGELARELVPVILFGALGFILTLIAAHLSVLLSYKPMRLLNELGELNISPVKIKNKFDEYTYFAKHALLWPHLMGYLALVCLIISLAIGTHALWHA